MTQTVHPTNQMVALADLAPHPRNYNRHPAAQVRKLAQSLRKFGQVRSVVVWRSTILAGHGVVEAAKSLKWQHIRADVLPDDYPEHLALAYVAADNELARQGDPDMAQLATILEEVKDVDAELLEAVGYTDAEFAALLAEVGGEQRGVVDAEPQIDRAEELRQKWGVEPGQLWQLGEHRIICGDCTDAAVVARVMAGEKADMIFTDPFYNDSIAKILQAISNTGCAHISLMCTQKQIIDFFKEQSEYEFMFDVVFVQNTPNSMMNKKVPYYMHKSLFYAAKKGSKTLFDCDNARGVFSSAGYFPSVIEYKKPKSEHHYAKDPDAIRKYLSGFAAEIIVDLYAGSGTTIIACDALHKKCRAVEINPAFVAVALDLCQASGIKPIFKINDAAALAVDYRSSQATGKTPERIDDGG
jgi:DNA modification methylase